MADDTERRHDARRSPYEMRTVRRRKMDDDGAWSYLEKRDGEDRRVGADRRADERRHPDDGES